MKTLVKLIFLFLPLLIAVSYTGNKPKTANENQEKQFWQQAKTPPMGWNSWDCYGPTVTETEIKTNADYMAEHLKQHGWEYIVVDIRWFVENDKAGGYNEKDPIYTIDEYGRFLPAVKKFPSVADGKGFKTLADYVHSKGLKFGIHLMRGIPVLAVKNNCPVMGTNLKASEIYSDKLQCGWLHDMYTIDTLKTGAQEYYNSIFNLYASWGVDYVKVDDLSKPYHQPEIELIRKAIEQCGRPMVFSTSPGATPLEKADHIVNRTNLWAMFRSPLMFGGDLPSNDEFTLSLLTNEEVLAVNQASAKNKQLKEENGLIVWTADVPGTEDKYVAFFNINDAETSEISVTLTELGVSGNYSVKDLWSKEDKDSITDKFTVSVDPHASVFGAVFKSEII